PTLAALRRPRRRTHVTFRRARGGRWHECSVGVVEERRALAKAPPLGKVPTTSGCGRSSLRAKPTACRRPWAEACQEERNRSRPSAAPRRFSACPECSHILRAFR